MTSNRETVSLKETNLTETSELALALGHINTERPSADNTRLAALDHATWQPGRFDVSAIVLPPVGGNKSVGQVQ